jgi:ankyrin repeat protein
VGAGLQDGWTPLHWAGKNGHIVIVDKLLAAGAALNIQNEVCATSPLPSLSANGAIDYRADKGNLMYQSELISFLSHRVGWHAAHPAPH